jgi:porin
MRVHHIESTCLEKLPQLLLLLFSFCVFADPVRSQIAQEETLGGPDSHETGQGPHGYLFGEWGGA